MVPALSRILKEDLVIDGYNLPRGVRIDIEVNFHYCTIKED